jgi:predicted nucleotidyltransferase
MGTLNKQLTRLLSRYPQLELAILFGSQAKGDTTGESDIDLALLFDTPISSSLKLELIELIAAKFGRPVDIIDLYFAAEPILEKKRHPMLISSFRIRMSRIFWP